MRFHLSVTFLPTSEVYDLVRTCDELGYDGIYVSDHFFNPRQLSSRYTYSTRSDGMPDWEKETSWPDPMCLISALGAITKHVSFTTGVFVAPSCDLLTVAKTVGTAAVLTGGRLRLGVGVGWCKEEFDVTGQPFSNRGRRLNEMIPALRALWQGGWVEHHGTYYDVPACQINPYPTSPVPILGGGHSEVALRRATTLCDGWIAASAYREDEAWERLAELDKARSVASTEGDPFMVYMALAEIPNVTLYKRFEEAGVTDLVCAPWMMVTPDPSVSPETLRQARRDECERFGDEIVARCR